MQSRCYSTYHRSRENHLRKQYRYPISKEYIEVPAGKANDGESIEDTAKRELEEETGLKASKLIKVGEIYPACAYSTEDITLFIAKNLKEGNIHRDEDEFIELITVDSKEFIKCVWMEELQTLKLSL